MPISDPRDISGLVAWYSSDAVTGVVSGTSMTQWDDLSGNNNHATALAGGGTAPQWFSTGGPSGGPRVRFPNASGNANGGYFSLPNLLSGATAGEIMTTIKSDNPPTCGTWAFGDGTGGSDLSHYPNSGTVYESFGLATGQRQSWAPSGGGAEITSWRRYNVWSALNDFAARLDEVSRVTYASATPTWDSSPRLGKGRRSGGGAFDYVLVGDMACVVIYNRKLTTGERSDLAAWLTANPSGGFASSTPDDPTNVEAVPTCDSALMTWDASDNADGYDVRLNAGSIIDVGDVLSHEFTGLAPSLTYTGEVRAYNDDGDSDWVPVTFNTLTAPNPPFGLVASLVTTESFQVCWEVMP